MGERKREQRADKNQARKEQALKDQARKERDRKERLCEEQRFDNLIADVAAAQGVQQMKAFCHHGRVSTYQHCMRVAWRSYRMNRVLHVGSDEQTLVRAAFLHDYFGYDWHHTDNSKHAVNHPCLAEERAARDFGLNDKERNIINAHMWPLPPTRIPRCREAWLVCAADKLCALEETLFMR